MERCKNKEKIEVFQRAYLQLSFVSKSYLSSLSVSRQFEVSGKQILLVHGSPDSIDEHLRNSTDLKRFRKLAKSTRADIIIFGHSHEFFMKQVNGTWFINSGSVGLLIMVTSVFLMLF